MYEVTNAHLERLKPIVEQILSRKYEQQLTVTHYTVEHNKEVKQHETSSDLRPSVHQRTS